MWYNITVGREVAAEREKKLKKGDEKMTGLGHGGHFGCVTAAQIESVLNAGQEAMKAARGEYKWQIIKVWNQGPKLEDWYEIRAYYKNKNLEKGDRNWFVDGIGKTPLKAMQDFISKTWTADLWPKKYWPNQLKD
jgi:hypothetical protein